MVAHNSRPLPGRLPVPQSASARPAACGRMLRKQTIDMTNLPVPWPPPNAAHQNLKSVTAQDALEHVHSGQRVFVQGAAATPQALLQALVERAPDLEHVEVVHMHADGPAPHIAPEMQRHLRHRALFVGSTSARRSMKVGPTSCRSFCPIFRRCSPAAAAARRSADPCLAAGRHGYCSLGTSVDVVPAAVDSARRSLPRSTRACRARSAIASYG